MRLARLARRRLLCGVVKSLVGHFVSFGRSYLLREVVRNGCCIVRSRQNAHGRVPALELLTDARLVVVIQAETFVVKSAQQSAAHDARTESDWSQKPQDGTDTRTCLRAPGARPCPP